MKAGLNWFLVKEKEEKGFNLPTSKNKELEVTSVGTTDDKLYDPNLIKGCKVILEPQARGVRLDDETVAYRVTQVIAII